MRKRMDALMVIDVDRGDEWADDIQDVANTEQKQVALALRQTLANWRENNGLIIFVTLDQDGKEAAQLSQNTLRRGCIVCDSSGKSHLAHFLGHRHGKDYEPVFIKADNDAFTNAKLLKFLRSKKVTKIFLAGCHTQLCVCDTANGALRNNISVTLLEQCAHPRLRDQARIHAWYKMATNYDEGKEHLVAIA